MGGGVFVLQGHNTGEYCIFFSSAATLHYNMSVPPSAYFAQLTKMLLVFGEKRFRDFLCYFYL